MTKEQERRLSRLSDLAAELYRSKQEDAEEGREVTDGERATLIVKVVLNELKDRGGFDSWWNTIDTTTKQDLVSTLQLKVKTQVEAHK